MWRALTECLPTTDQLRVRRVDVNIMCPMCNTERETVYHILLQCPFAKLCWAHIGYLRDSEVSTNLMQWMSTIMQHHEEERRKVVMLLWSIWKNRNDIVWNQKGMEPSDVVVLANLCFSQWKSAQDKSFDNFLGFMTQADGKERWECPTEGMVKINTDAAIFEESSRYSVSMIARSNIGQLIEARSKCRQGTTIPVLAEAIGIREALSWIKNKDWQAEAVVLETDCLALVQAIRCSSINLSYLGRVVEDCKSLLDQLQNRNIVLNFVKRSANKVAHFIARQSSSIADQVAHFIARQSSSIADRIWKEGDAHPDLSFVILNDLVS